MSSPNGKTRPINAGPTAAALASLGADLLRRAEDSRPALESTWDELMARWGVIGNPVGAERVRDLIRQERGEGPDDIEFSRELIALRGDRGP